MNAILVNRLVYQSQFKVYLETERPPPRRRGNSDQSDGSDEEEKELG